MTTTTVAEPAYWSPGRKIALRFFFIFFIQYIIFNPNGVLPNIDKLYEIYIEPIHKLIVWIGAHILRLDKPITVFTNGSGDTTYDNVLLLFGFFLAVAGSLIWTLADRKARNYNNLFYWLTVIVRYYVAITMVTYGCVKIIKLQFPGPTPDKLLQPFGNASPMGLAWTYMGYSTGFNYFTGMAEFLCGILLFFRRTATLGAIIGLVVAGNIMAINYCFDVPVKLLSTMLVVMCAYILSKDFIRLLNFFILNKPAQPANLGRHQYKKRWKNITLTTVKYILVIYTVAMSFYGDVQARTQYGDLAQKPPLYGIYNVQSFIRNKDTIPPLKTDTTRWDKLVVSYEGRAKVIMSDDTSRTHDFKIDTVKHTIAMYSYSDTSAKSFYKYSQPNKDLLVLKGTLKKDSVTINLKKFDINKFRLINRGFHWINEYPYNR
ncbi:hypothetical protein [Mucilaginibacter phyllosphaerae]|uniref:DoxX family protein n=1 Tax=Mucilaginibacter phyllosphaerae TaxID=1812349 RepID=A0A4Y8AI58_9SPHI|nr:hypothetical protein [Mucilaginibacter phyllosphaerae]MBB3968410.1 hypothetical protein [Mucilaginibacter phyllosphaerae]TEW67942.1 hypothetical protein E2R65_08115 [Mucilaginibacter phyllosphaerae]GGH16169.1 hypothetical protein GCM10007352_25400 [Mucilaginibacter phyllosphaerae]